MDFNKKKIVAFVTGGASGIGESIVEMIASNGGKVVIADLNLRGEEIADRLGPNVLFYQTDVTSEDSVTDAINFTKIHFGKLSVVVNSAGIVRLGPIYDFVNDKPESLDDFRKLLQVNTLGTFNVMTRSIGLMKDNVPDEDGQRGVIINIGSVAGFDGGAKYVAYGASKAAVMAMTETTARHVASVGIRVVAVAPGFIETPIHGHLAPDRATQFGSIAMFPNRLGRTTEIAHLIKCLIENSFINSEIIRIDAGVRLGNKK